MLSTESGETYQHTRGLWRSASSAAANSTTDPRSPHSAHHKERPDGRRTLLQLVVLFTLRHRDKVLSNLCFLGNQSIPSVPKCRGFVDFVELLCITSKVSRGTTAADAQPDRSTIPFISAGQRPRLCHLVADRREDGCHAVAAPPSGPFLADCRV